MRLTVVVDGGASGCRLRAYDADGAAVADAREGPASLSLGVETAFDNIRLGIQNLASQLGQAHDWMPHRLALGLAGALQESRRQSFLDLFPDTLVSTLVTDGHAQLLGATGGKPGACIALGTGSVLHWLDAEGTNGMAGGWGFPAGDEGSGAWLGLQLLNYYLRERDGYAQPLMSVALRHELEAKVGTTTSSIQLWTTSKEPAKFAALVPQLHTSAEAGDPVAQTIVKRGVQEVLALLAVSPPELPVYVVGGLTPVYLSHLKNVLEERLHRPVGDALDGLYHLCGTEELT